MESEKSQQTLSNLHMLRLQHNWCASLVLHAFKSRLTMPFPLSSFGLQQAGVRAQLDDRVELEHDGCTEALTKQLGALRQELAHKDSKLT
ncbi:MAG: hypothetical protein ACTHJ4_07880 [Candidatus Nucleicultricaceae bacterium]